MHQNAIRPYIQSVVSDIEPSDVDDEDYVSFQLITKIWKPKITFHKNLLSDTEDEQLPVTSCLVLNVVETPPGEANRAVNKSQRTHRGSGFCGLLDYCVIMRRVEERKGRRGEDVK
jgi:hypothetical protein